MRKPRVDFDAITQQGVRALGLFTEQRDVLEPRLPAGFGASLETALEELGAKVPGAGQARDAAQAATATKRTALEHGHVLVSAVHVAVSHAGLPKDVQRKYGVGGGRGGFKTQKEVVKGIDEILERATAKPAEAAGIGILPADLAALRAARTEIVGAANEKQQKQASAPRSTQARNQAAQQVLASVRKLVGVGVLAFATDAVERGKFEALLGLGAPKKRKKGGAEAGGGAAGAA